MAWVSDKTHVGPGLSAIGRLVDAVPMRDVAPDGGLAGPDVEDVGIGLVEMAMAPTAEVWKKPSEMFSQ